MTDNKKPRPPTEKVRKDAKGQFAGTQAGGDNSGVSSAKPRVITHSDDATIHNAPAGTEHPPKQRQRQKD